MSKRLQVILKDNELAEIQQIARRHHMTVSEWVRRILRAARQDEPAVDSRKKLDTIRAAKEHAFPTSDIDEMLADIERGYLSNNSK